MDDRRQDEGRDDRSRGEQERGRYGQGKTSEMTTREGRDIEGRGSTGGGGGDWQGYVVPYRYYGPGYRGVGYYSVMYQGSGGGSEQDDAGDASSAQSGRQRESAARRDPSGAQGWRPGGFAGRGPKGYQRSDERLREEISDRLMEDDSVDATDVEIKVTGGEVTLTGTVPDRWMKRRAEDCAEQVMGVRDVMNQIRVQSEQGFGRAGDTTQEDSSKSRRASTRTTQPDDHASAAPNGQRPSATSGTR